MPDSTSALPRYRKLGWAAFLLGVALGGFFDGILLHQILQWHHLLSGLEGSLFQDIRVQVLADGLFHVLMYLIAIWGLILMWKNRGGLNLPGSGRLLLAQAFIGFGAWHIVDSIVSHWLLRIHRIRMDVDNPLFWDLLWFVVFGVAFVAIGWLMLRRIGQGPGGGSSKPVAGMLVLAVTLLAPIAALPPQGQNTVLVFFKQDTPGIQVFQAAEAAQARIIWSSAQGNIWAMEMPDKRGRSRLSDYGAYWVASSPMLIGCLAWSTTRAS